MKFNKNAELIRLYRVDDGIGGEKVTLYTIANISVFTTPVRAEMTLKQYGIDYLKSLKLFTKDEIPEGYDYIKFENKKYKVRESSDFGKIKLFLIEEV